MPEHSADHTRERIDNAPVSDLLRRSPDLLGARAAMKRAAEAARKLAEQTGAELVVGKFYFDGFYEGGNLERSMASGCVASSFCSELRDGGLS